MIDRKGVVLHGHLHAAGAGKLVGVDFRYQTVSLSGRKNSIRFSDREESLVAEHIDIFSKPFGGDGRNHLLADEVDIFILPAFEGSADGVRPEEGRLDGGGGVALDAADHPKHLQLVLQGQAVAALDLDRAGSFGDHFPHARHCL